MISLLQSANDLQQVITTDNATVQGILIGLVIALGAATIYLYKENRSMQKDLIQQLKESQAAILEANKMYSDFIANIKQFLGKDVRG
jgi:Na+/melibiose symporter-like transporter